MTFDLQLWSKLPKVALVYSLQLPVGNIQLSSFCIFRIDILVDPYKLLTSIRDIFKMPEFRKNPILIKVSPYEIWLKLIDGNSLNDLNEVFFSQNPQNHFFSYS